MSASLTPSLTPSLTRLLCVAGLLAAGTAHADLMGDTVGARLQEFGAGTAVLNQFDPTAVVDGFVEFNGAWTYAPLGQLWNVALDIGASSFTITFTEDGNSSTHDLGGFTFIGLQLTDLDAGANITGVTVLSGGEGVQSIGFGDHGITVQWNLFEFRDAAGLPTNHHSWTFGIETAAVPEPTPAATLMLGLAALAAVGYRKRRA
jgi:hypothetical protein